MRNWTIPRTVTDVRSFLGFTNYCRRFIKDYAKVARSLNVLISGENASKKRKLIEWTEECQVAFDKLKEWCTSTPILAYADYKKEFPLHTDASELGLGGVLYQADDKGILGVRAYASRSLSQTERNYPAHKLEVLALKLAVTDHFYEYLYGGKFDVYTDNNPLTYILSSAKLDACGQRGVTSLANYDLRLFYKTEKSNIEVDALSRIAQEEYHELESPMVKALLKASQEGDWTDFNGNPTEIVCKSSQLVSEKMTAEQWKLEQAEDEAISQVMEALQLGTNTHVFTSEQAKQMYRFRSKFVMKHGLFMRNTMT